VQIAGERADDRDGVQSATATVGPAPSIESAPGAPARLRSRAKACAAAVDVAIAATDTLSDVRDKINASGAGVTAMIMTTARLALLIRSSATGADGGFRTSGVAPLAFRSVGRVTTNDADQTAANAAATVNGLAVSSAQQHARQRRRRPDADLTAVTTAPVNVNVATDRAAIKKTITDFAAAYTAVIQLIATDTK
jgi:flagellar hook-associated protein 2